MVLPSGTLTSSPSMVIVTNGTDVPFLPAGLGSWAFICFPPGHGGGRSPTRCIPGSLTEAADRGILHHKTDIAKQDDVALLRRGVAAVARDAQQRLLLAYRAYAAGHTLAAGLVAEEAGDAQKDAGQINSVVEGQNHARAQRNFVGANALEGERDVELVTAYEAARRA